MKKQTIKQLALLGLASGLLAATSGVEGAEGFSYNGGMYRSANGRSQPIAGCGTKNGGCAAIADSYAPTTPPVTAPGQPAGGIVSPQDRGKHQPIEGPVEQGCAPKHYTVNTPTDGGEAPLYPNPANKQPQGSFRYIGDTTEAPPTPTTYPAMPSNGFPQGSSLPVRNARTTSNMQYNNASANYSPGIPSQRYLSDVNPAQNPVTPVNPSPYPSQGNRSQAAGNLNRPNANYTPFVPNNSGSGALNSYTPTTVPQARTINSSNNPSGISSPFSGRIADEESSKDRFNSRTTAPSNAPGDVEIQPMPDSSKKSFW